MAWSKEQLGHPKWQRKRLEIFSRDEWACRWCADTNTTLLVHHMKYIYGRMIWDYPDDLLITVCKPCHDDHHGIVHAVKMDFSPIPFTTYEMHGHAHWIDDHWLCFCGCGEIFENYNPGV